MHVFETLALHDIALIQISIQNNVGLAIGNDYYADVLHLCLVYIIFHYYK